MQDIEKKILSAVNHPRYGALKPRALARKIGLEKRYEDYKVVLKSLIKAGKVVLAKNQTIRAAEADPATEKGLVTGTYRKTGSGIAFVRPQSTDGTKHEEIYVAEHAGGDASTGDSVLVRITKQTPRGPRGQVVRVLERATRNFVGTY